MTILDKRTATSEPVYSNLDHILDDGVVAELKADPSLWGQHAGFHFCGWIRWDAEAQEWVEEVWRFKSVITTYRDKDIAEVIRQTIENFGAE